MAQCPNFNARQDRTAVKDAEPNALSWVITVLLGPQLLPHALRVLSVRIHHSGSHVLPEITVRAVQIQRLRAVRGNMQMRRAPAVAHTALLDKSLHLEQSHVSPALRENTNFTITAPVVNLDITVRVRQARPVAPVAHTARQARNFPPACAWATIQWT